MWAVEIATDGVFITYSPKLDPPRVIRVIRLYSGAPSHADIEKMQNYLESYNAVPIGYE
jgi:hypothetical protein